MRTAVVQGAGRALGLALAHHQQLHRPQDTVSLVRSGLVLGLGLRRVAPSAVTCIRRAAATNAAPALQPDFESSDPLRVLGLPPTATAGEIKRAYYRLALQYHPDSAQQPSAAAELRFQRIGDAYRAALQRVDMKATATLTAEVASVRLSVPLGPALRTCPESPSLTDRVRACTERVGSAPALGRALAGAHRR